MGKLSIPTINTVGSIGQSNDVGAGVIAQSTYPTTNANIFVYYKTDNTLTDNGAWQSINWGTNTNNADTGVTPGFGYQNSLTELLRTYLGTDIYLIKAGRGGTAIYDNPAALNFNIAEEGAAAIGGKPQLYDLFKNYFTIAMTRAASKGIINMKGITWFQGENDMLNGTVSAPYQVNEIALFNKIRGIANLNNVKFISILVNPPAAAYAAQKATVIAAKTTNATNNPTYVSTISISDFTLADYAVDETHLNTAAYEKVGLRAHNLIKDN